MADVLTVADLELAKKHDTFHSEVITGKAGGLAGGASIDTATNAVTGQVQTTLPKVLRDVGFKPAPFNFVTGGTLGVTDADKCIYNPAPSGDDNWYSWSGTLPHTVAPGTDPTADVQWVPRTDITLQPQVIEALRRSYADAGYTLVDGSFEEGGTLTSATDVLLHKASGKAYSWSGPFPKVVTAGSTPATSGGIGAGAWVDRTDARPDVEERLLGVGAKIYRGSNWLYVQNGDVVPVGTTHLIVLINGKPEIVVMHPVASGTVSNLTETGATIGGTNVYLLTLAQYEQYKSCRVNLKDWGVIADNLTDNSDALLYVKEIMKTKPNATWVLYHSESSYYDGVIRYTDNSWLSGIKRVELEPMSLMCTAVTGVYSEEAPLASTSPFYVNEAEPSPKEAGDLIQTAEIGERVITFLNAEDSDKYAVGDSVLIYGYSTQYGGVPTNARYFDYGEIAEVGVGTITLVSGINNRYDDTWPDWDGTTSGMSAPRIIPYTKRFSLGWTSDLQANEYAKFNNVNFRENPNVASTFFIFVCKDRYLIDCKLEGNIKYFSAQNSRICVTENLEHAQQNNELDKLTDLCIINNPKRARLTQGTGVNRVIVNGGSVEQSFISPRNYEYNNVNLNGAYPSLITDKYIIGRPSQGQVVLNSMFNNCQFKPSANQTQFSNQHLASGPLIPSGRWFNQGADTIVIDSTAYGSLSDYIVAVAGIHEGSVITAKESTSLDAAVVTGLSFSGINLVISLSRALKDNFSLTSDLRVENDSPTTVNCNFDLTNRPYGQFMTPDMLPESSSFGQGRLKKVTYTKYDLLTETVVNSCRVISVKCVVTKAYTGVGNAAVCIYSTGGPVGKQIISFNTGVVGSKSYEIGDGQANSAYLENIMSNFRITKLNGTPADWFNRSVSSEFFIEVTYIPLF